MAILLSPNTWIGAAVAAAVALLWALLWHGPAKFDEGVLRERAANTEETRKLQAEHDQKVALLQAEIADIERELFVAIDRQLSQQQQFEVTDEDFSVPPDEPVFSDRVLEHFNTLRRH